MELHNLSPFKYSKTSKKRLGRGHGSGHGTYSSRGMKGQSARSGVSNLKRLGMRHIVLQTPKLGGFRSIHAKPFVVNVGMLDRVFESGSTVTPQDLVAKKLVDSKSSTKISIKILGNGEIKKQITVQGCAVSSTAREKIEKAGGAVK